MTKNKLSFLNDNLAFLRRNNKPQGHLSRSLSKVTLLPPSLSSHKSPSSFALPLPLSPTLKHENSPSSPRTACFHLNLFKSFSILSHSFSTPFRPHFFSSSLLSPPPRPRLVPPQKPSTRRATPAAHAAAHSTEMTWLSPAGGLPNNSRIGSRQ